MLTCSADSYNCLLGWAASLRDHPAETHDPGHAVEKYKIKLT